ncbi:MAG: hypothetical protein Q4B67_05935 [Eubacteriales bacterium]|nr:hypothetical protein [Eubacteriales bacterium]
MATKKEKGSGFYRNNKWILFRKSDGKIGVLADDGKETPSGVVKMSVHGDLDKACKYAEDIENDISTQYSVFDFIEK